MVRKLFKYEVKSYLRTLLPVNLIVLVIAAFARIMQFFESKSIAYDIVFGSSSTLLFLGIVVLLIMTEIIAVTRFYINLYTTQGYLSFTLPVTPTQHIFVKLITAVVFLFLAFVTSGVAVAIYTSGELFVEIIKALKYVYDMLYALEGVHIPIVLAEIIIIIAASSAYGILLYYTCISIGQRARKNRIFMAIAVYFVYYLITQIISTVFVVIMMFIVDSDLLHKFLMWLTENYMTFIHCTLIGGIVFITAMNVLWYVINKNIMKNHLNLE